MVPGRTRLEFLVLWKPTLEIWNLKSDYQHPLDFNFFRQLLGIWGRGASSDFSKKCEENFWTKYFVRAKERKWAKGEPSQLVNN